MKQFLAVAGLIVISAVSAEAQIPDLISVEPTQF